MIREIAKASKDLTLTSTSAKDPQSTETQGRVSSEVRVLQLKLMSLENRF